MTTGRPGNDDVLAARDGPRRLVARESQPRHAGLAAFARMYIADEQKVVIAEFGVQLRVEQRHVWTGQVAGEPLAQIGHQIGLAYIGYLGKGEYLSGSFSNQ